MKISKDIVVVELSIKNFNVSATLSLPLRIPCDCHLFFESVYTFLYSLQCFRNLFDLFNSIEM